MNAKPSLLEFQKAFLAALYDAAAPGPLASIAGNGLAPEARLQIYRHSCNEIQTAALRTNYPAVMALVGQDWFDKAARRYRQRYPSHVGNLQVFGAHFADYLETIPHGRTLPYLADIARLEWLRQEAVLAADEQALEFDDFVTCLDAASEALRISLCACIRWLASCHQVLTIWRFALTPDGNLALGDKGENVLLLREGGEVAMASVDSATFAFLCALAAGVPLDEARMATMALDVNFDAPGCMNGFIQHHLVARVLPHAVKGGGRYRETCHLDWRHEWLSCAARAMARPVDGTARTAPDAPLGGGCVLASRYSEDWRPRGYQGALRKPIPGASSGARGGSLSGDLG